jgi:hypothetical protein
MSITAGLRDGTGMSRTVSLREARNEAEEEVREAWKEVMEPLIEELTDIQCKAERIVKGYRPKLGQMRAQLERLLSPLDKRLKGLQAEFQKAASEFDVDLPDKPGPILPEPRLLYAKVSTGRGRIRRYGRDPHSWTATPVHNTASSNNPGLTACLQGDTRPCVAPGLAVYRTTQQMLCRHAAEGRDAPSDPLGCPLR